MCTDVPTFDVGFVFYTSTTLVVDIVGSESQNVAPNVPDIDPLAIVQSNSPNVFQAVFVSTCSTQAFASPTTFPSIPKVLHCPQTKGQKVVTTKASRENIL